VSTGTPSSEAGADDNMPQRLWMSVPEAGALVGLGRSASYDAARRGQLPVRRLNGRLIVPVPAFKKWLEGCDGDSQIAGRQGGTVTRLGDDVTDRKGTKR
jgi:hypothetical protein